MIEYNDSWLMNKLLFDIFCCKPVASNIIVETNMNMLNVEYVCLQLIEGLLDHSESQMTQPNANQSIRSFPERLNKCERTRRGPSWFNP